MERGRSLIIAVLAFVVLFSGTASAVFCCEKTVDLQLSVSGYQGGYCQQVDDANSCDSAFGKAPTSCDQTTYCQAGICIDDSAGECSRTERATCLASSGTSVEFSTADISTIDRCQEGCCIIGDTVSFGTETQCKQIAEREGVDTNFREDLDSAACFSLDLVRQKGACVRKVGFEKQCSVETKEKCNTITDAIFYNGLLCSAPGISDAIKPAEPKTICGDDGKVYFTDSEGNIANIYDASKDGKGSDNANEVRDYWTYLKEPECEVGFDSNGRPVSNCGACQYRLGTVCSKYDSSSALSYAMPASAPTSGNNVCRAMSCKDEKGIIYNHAETWCASGEDAPGTYPSIPNLIDFGVRNNTDIESNSTSYNLPGSEYYQLRCWDGEIIPDACGAGNEGARAKICSESYIETNGEEGTQKNAFNVNSDFSVGVCRANNWELCPGMNDSISCENPELDCKWIHGYRYSITDIRQQFLGDPNELPESGWQLNEDGDYAAFGTADEQGSCVPLFAPAFNFWNSQSTGAASCATGTVVTAALYETHWLTARDHFGDAPVTDAAHRCLEDCFAIPGYGTQMNTNGLLDENGNLKTDEQIVEDFYESVTGLPGNPDQYNISLRKGQYCDPFGNGEKIEGRAIGPILVNPPACADNENRLIKPLFYTNTQWLNFLKERAYSLGDCGYKTNAAGTPGQKNTEIITAIFQKLDQNQTAKDEGGSLETIYQGDSWTFGEFRSGTNEALA
jgi:hypothetical protein